MVPDLRVLLRLNEGPPPYSSAAILGSRTVQSTPTSGARAVYDGAKRNRGSKAAVAVDTLGHCWLCRSRRLKRKAGSSWETGKSRAGGHEAADLTGLCRSRLYRVSAGRCGSVTQRRTAGGQAPGSQARRRTPTRRWVVERTFAWVARFRRLVRDYERLPETLAALDCTSSHLSASCCRWRSMH
ncbi:transposase [Ferribacterium limneticum]|uniref:transposase n=1 Tax=Ferribacterium limneticum TaxID=76259 RepID=UPI00384B6E4D